ncbi:MAG: helix-turn-helix domain-containing protein [Treponema sp.]|jgi:transcriptional regulator with XRE-family HTH domain|nr:helix-turn-helix domain-containing protein [Treponema sp.]
MEMTISKRIRHLRKTLKMSQVEFAKAIYISNGYIAELECEHRRVNNRIIHLISLTFGVNEVWLKTGEGDMFFNTSGKKLQRMVSMFNELSPKFQDYVMLQIEQLLSVTDTVTDSTIEDSYGNE